MNTCRLVVNADDFGLSRGVNEAVIKAHTGGIVTSTSLMVRAGSAREAAELARGTPTLDVGLHLDVGEWAYREGSWIAIYERVDPADEVGLEREVCAQLELFEGLLGRTPTHLDSHQHAHRRSPLNSVVRRVAETASIPVRHLSSPARYIGMFFGQDEHGEPLEGRLDPGWLSGFLAQLPDGIWELCCHPAARIDFKAGYSGERLQEFRTLCSPEVRAAVAGREIELVGFGELASLPKVAPPSA